MSDQPDSVKYLRNLHDEIDRLRADLACCTEARDAARSVADLNRAELAYQLSLREHDRAELARESAKHCAADLLWRRAEAAITRVRELCELASRDRDSGVGIEDIVNALEGNQP